VTETGDADFSLNVLGFGDPYRKALTNAKEELRQIS